MANRNLNAEELKQAHLLLDEICGKLEILSGDDLHLLFAYRRKIYKELIYLERGKPMQRRKLKIQKYDLQHGKCAHCSDDIAIQYSELDRKNAADGYTLENTELVHAKCHQARQAAKGYT
ncbi:MAG: hypothetical protein P4L87_05040 [Formivibrio sp.]|nr:hypothetical protein [Formivibrio sp.]